ncbi:hypothetical protein GEMRC1_000005 [Eukaryota sp. GEM-RC1]
MGGATSYPSKVLHCCLWNSTRWLCCSFAQQTTGLGFHSVVAGSIFYYDCTFPFEEELVWRIPNITIPILLLFYSVLSIIFGWFPDENPWLYLAGALVSVVFVILFHKHHKVLEGDQSDLEDDESSALIVTTF